MGIRQIGVALIVSAMCAWSGCGGSDSPTAPSDPGTGGGGGGGGGTGVSAATITITASGVSPSSVTIASGNRVTFVNNDTVVHEMASDPHPIHTDCPGLNIGQLGPGQTRDTANLTTRRTCGFHDHINPDTASLKGTITVQ
jgi:plastocyanin